MKVDAGYGLPFDSGPLQGLLDKRLPAHGLPEPVHLDAVWAPGFFALDAVPAYRDASEATRRAILGDCARGTLLEAYFIEKAGVSYAAKMILLAPTAEERSLYAMFAAEEAAHLDAMRAALGPSAEDADWQSDPFLGWLRSIVERADRPTSQLVVQLVLEGWGLRHYASMRDACHDEALRGVFDRIVADEAAHHGSAVQLLRCATLDAATVDHAVDLLADLLAMVKAGPAMVVSALERGLGGFTTHQREQTSEHLQSDRHVAHRLQILRRCLEKVPAARPVVAKLVERGGFARGVA
ncbi:MAG: ferritin-like domain-containing protein [Myxococcota bacterium]